MESTQNKQDRKDYRIAVIFDELGLAEKSKQNPLKVLHKLLEKPNVSFVGISNWTLDAAKMNRAVHLSRPPLNQQDLLESARAIIKIPYDLETSKTLERLASDFAGYI